MKVAAAILLFGGVAVELACCAGLLLSRTVYARLHFLGPATTVAPVSIAAAVVISEGLSQAGIKAIIIALVLFVTSPVLTHATARMAYLQERGASEAKGRAHADAGNREGRAG